MIDGQGYQHIANIHGNDIVINQGLDHNASYEIKIVPISLWGAKADPALASTHTVTLRGKHDPPQKPAYMSGRVQGDYYYLTWDCSEELDHDHIELRYGDEWLGSQFIACLKGNQAVLPIHFIESGNLLARSVNRTRRYSQLFNEITITYPSGEYRYDYYQQYDPEFNGTLSGAYAPGGTVYLATGNTTGTYTVEVTGLSYDNRQVILDLRSRWQTILPQAQHMGFAWDSDYAVNTTLDQITGSTLQGIENDDTDFYVDTELIPLSGLYSYLNTFSGQYQLQNAASVDPYISLQDNAGNWSSYQRYYLPVRESFKGIRVRVNLSSQHVDIIPEIYGMKLCLSKGKSIPLSGITDVRLTNPSNGQALTYSNGRWVNSNVTGGTGSGADPDLSYLTIGDETADLPNSRYLDNGYGISVLDGGAGNSFTISVNTGSLNNNYSLSGHNHSHSTLTNLTADDHTQYILKTPSSSTRNIISGNYVGLTVKQVIGQSTDMFRIRNSGDTANHFAVASDGATQYAGGLTYIGNDGGIWIGGRNTTYDYAQVIIANGTTTRQLLVGDGVGQYINLEVYRNPIDAVLNTNRCFRVKGENGATEINLQTADSGLTIKNNMDNSNPLLAIVNTGTLVAKIMSDGKATCRDIDIGFTDPSGYYQSTNGSLTGHLQEVGRRLTQWWDYPYNVHTMNGGSITYAYTATCPMDAFGHTALGGTTTTLGYKVYEVPAWHEPTGGIAFQLGWFHTGRLANNGENPTGNQWRLQVRFRSLNPAAISTPFYASSTNFTYDFNADATVTPSGRYYLTGFTIPYTSTGTHVQIACARLAAASTNVEFTGRIFVNALRPGSAVMKG